jgi:hypothetical protein
MIDRTHKFLSRDRLRETRMWGDRKSNDYRHKAQDHFLMPRRAVSPSPFLQVRGQSLHNGSSSHSFSMRQIFANLLWEIN